MANDLPPAARAGSSLTRKLSMIGIAVIVLAIVLYFVVTSSGFLKAVVLPRVSQSLHAQVTADQVSLRPFSQLTLTKLVVQTPGAPPIVTADQVQVRFSLWSFLTGNYVIDELALTAPTVQRVQEANGTSNTDPLTQPRPTTEARDDKAAKPIRLTLQNVVLTNATLRSVTKTKAGSTQTAELRGFNLGLTRIQNGQPGRLQVASVVRLENEAGPTGAATNDLLSATLNTTLDYKLGGDLLPETLTGNGALVVSQTAGAYKDLQGLASRLQAELTPTDLRQLALRFERAGTNLGRVQASGPLNLAKVEGRLKVEVQSIDRQVLNLFGATRGLDFGDSTINATNYVDLAQAGRALGGKGHLSAQRFSLRQGTQATPPLNLEADYEVSLDLENQTAILRQLALDGQQQNTKLIHASLDRPMTFTWAPNARGFGESTLQLTLAQLALQDWQALLGSNTPAGMVDLQITLTARQDGKELATKANGSIRDCTIAFSTNRIEKATVAVSLEALLSDFKDLRVDRYSLELQKGDQMLLKTSGSAHSDLAKKDLNVQANAAVDLPSLLRQVPLEGWTSTNGSIRLSCSITSRDNKHTCTGNLTLGDFTGHIGAYAFDDFQGAFDYNFDLEPPALQIHSASLALRHGYKGGGTIGLRGDYDMAKQSSHLSFTIVGLNEEALQPILGPSLGADQRLVSIMLGGSGTAAYDPKGSSSFQTDLSITNWVVASAETKKTTPALNARLKLDGTLRQNVLELQPLLVTLSPTEKAKNQLELKARLDLARTNGSPSQLTLRAESLDLTPYQQMFAGTSNPKAAAPAPPAKRGTTVPPSGPTSEPQPAQLPVQQLTADVKIDRLYYGELAVTNLQAGARIAGGEVTMRPFALTVNGAPLSLEAMLNLGVPGYTYDLSFQTDRLPLGPLAATFMTNAAGLQQGQIRAQGQLKGAGVTGANLQKNLTGNLTLALTNMNYAIVSPKINRLLEPIALVLRVPELTQTPINWIAAQTDIGQGQIAVRQFALQSQAFVAESQGAIPIGETLGDSRLKLPVNLSLRRALAEKASLLPANTPTNAAYVALPPFVTLVGTLAEPQSEINKLALVGLATKTIGGIVPVGDKAGAILQNLGGVLSGQPAGNAATNAPAATNAKSPASLIQDLSGLLNRGGSKGRSNTNPPAASTNKPARR
ncbi:MAG: AsmA-like C-terminal region-containing protein [Verrucomicrobiota bacterium]